MHTEASLTHKAYLVAVAIKGFDGAVEILLGLLVAIAGAGWLHTFAIWTVAPDLASSLGNGTAHLVRHGADQLARSSTFASIYLLTHGPLKLAIAICLLRGDRWIYPIASLILLGFVIYMSSKTMVHWSWWLAGFALFDAITLALVVNEWRKPARRPKHKAAQQAA